MTPDPRTEEIRAALEDIAPNSWVVTDAGRVLNDARPDRGRFIAQARDNGLARFIAESPRRLAYLLGRIEALEARLSGRDALMVIAGDVARTTAHSIDQAMSAVLSATGLLAERDRYRAESAAKDAVVKAAREYARISLAHDLPVWDRRYRDGATTNRAWRALRAALDALDGGEGE